MFEAVVELNQSVGTIGRRIVMAQCVAGEAYESITGQLFEIGRQLRQPNGYPYDPELTKKALQDVIEGRFGTSVDIPNFKYDKRNDGWRLMEDCGFNPALASVTDLELVLFLKDGESRVNGETMANRAKELKGNLGQKHAEYSLEHQKEIPKEFRKYFLVFPGTIWRHSDGHRNVPYLSWDGDGWYLHWRWLDHGNWNDNDRLLRLRG